MQSLRTVQIGENEFEQPSGVDVRPECMSFVEACTGGMVR